MITKLKNIGIALLICMGAVFAVLVVLRGYSWRTGLIVGGILTALYAWRELTYKPPAQGAARPAPQQAGTVHDVGRSALTAVVIIDIALYILYFACAVWIRVPAWIMMGVPLGITALILIPWMWTWRIEPEPNTISAEFFYRHLVLGRSVREGWKVYIFRGLFFLLREATYSVLPISDTLDGADVWTKAKEPDIGKADGAPGDAAKIHRGQALLDIALSSRFIVADAARIYRAIGFIKLPASRKEGEGEKGEDNGTQPAESEPGWLLEVLTRKVTVLTRPIMQGAMQNVVAGYTDDELLDEKRDAALDAMRAYIQRRVGVLGLTLDFLDYSKIAVGENMRKARERAAEEERETDALLRRIDRYEASVERKLDQRIPGLRCKNPLKFHQLVERGAQALRSDDQREKFSDVGPIGAILEGIISKLRSPGQKGSGKRGGAATEPPLDDEDQEDLSGSRGTGSRRGGN